MRTITVTALAIAVICAPAAIAAPKPRAVKAAKPSSKPAVLYDFKGARLGMTVAEWRALTPPSEPPTYVSRPACAGEQFNGEPITASFYAGEAEKAANVLVCGYVYRGASGTSGSWRRYPTPLGKVNAADVDYKFLDGRLYEINVTTNTDAAADVLDGLNTRWGKPTSVTKGTTQNKAGASFPHTIQIWSNRVASIQFEGPYTRINNLNITYATKAGSKKIDSIQEALHPSAEKM